MKHPRLQLNKRAFWCGVAVLVLLRCSLTSFQQAYTWVGGAPLDDELMFRAANHITAGRRAWREIRTFVLVFESGWGTMMPDDKNTRLHWGCHVNGTGGYGERLPLH